MGRCIGAVYFLETVVHPAAMRARVLLLTLGFSLSAIACDPPDDDSGDDTAGMGEQEVLCGGFLGDTCTEEEYCAYEEGQHCGAADATSTCELRPEACPAVYMPVCGCDGNTYGNSCEAAASGTGVLHEGECEPPPPGGFCGGFAGIECPEGQVCVDDETDDCDPAMGGADCAGVCVVDDVPAEPCVIGGCNAELCASEPLFSPCIALPEFACYADAACGHFGPGGSCAWDPTEELTSCLESFE